MYEQIASNKRKSILLIAVFVSIVTALGFVFSQVSEFGPSAIVIALLFSAGSSLVSYYASDKIALALSGAKEIKKNDNPSLWNLVENLCITAGIPMPKVHIISDNAINAFATGRDPAHAAIAVTTGALKALENEELEGVLAHELSHIQNYDIRLMTIVVVLVGTVAILTDIFLRSMMFGDRDDRKGAGVFVIIGIVLALLSPIVSQLIKLAVSRKREFLADSSGALLTRYPEGLARALEKISAQNTPMKKANNGTAHLFISNPFGNNSRKMLVHLFSTHPPLEERIKILRTMA